MDRREKEALVASLRERFDTATSVVVTQQKGLTVAQSMELRRKARDAGANYKVTKNRLAKLALDGTKFQALSPLMTGPTALAISDDAVAGAKVCAEFAKKNDKLTIIGGSLNGELLDEDGVKALAALPSLDELRGKIVGLVQTPATNVAGVLQAPAGQLARVFGAYGATDEAA
ncbi:50S ribosomal protein L10 [Fodinicurvata fenggangensis]|uniref:50S ribosomal protein L10 n=1 Tax=Fodinicurvata fenggangensis TaxID=1121830 RepID=UPI00047E39C5|nr:50S ribosomal protein L10 [Fodinicurvata fenggangensis]